MTSPDGYAQNLTDVGLIASVRSMKLDEQRWAAQEAGLPGKAALITDAASLKSIGFTSARLFAPRRGCAGAFPLAGLS